VTAKRTLYCDAEDCDTHGSNEHPGWITVRFGENTPAKHFCDGDCLFKWAGAHSEPPTIIPMHDPPSEDPG
jgi:hypothetical protein